MISKIAHLVRMVRRVIEIESDLNKGRFDCLDARFDTIESRLRHLDMKLDELAKMRA